MMQSCAAMDKSETMEESKMGSETNGNNQHHRRIRNPSLFSQDWYWPYTTRQEAEQSIAGQPDGAYLIRDSHTPGDFTLTVRKDSCTKCVRIYSFEKGFSLANSASDAQFAELSDLVEFYLQNSLSSFNKNLDIKLTQAVLRPAIKGSSQFGVFKELYDLSQEQLSLHTRLSILKQQRAVLLNNVKVFELMMPALHMIKDMYSSSIKQQTELGPMRSVNSVFEPTAEQMASSSPGAQSKTPNRLTDIQVLSICESDEDNAASDSDDESYEHFCQPFSEKLVATSSSSTTATESKRDDSTCNDLLAPKDKDQEWLRRSLSRDEEISVTANTRLLMSRHLLLKNKIDSARSKYEAELTMLKDLKTELRALELTMIHLQKQQDQLTRQLMELGCDREYLRGVMHSQVATREYDRSTWLVDCDREQALSLLEGLPHGTFLVRHKTDRRHIPFVLSVMVAQEKGGTEVQHCYIVRPQNRGYGFNPSLAVFESLDQLILRHRYVSLKHYFSCIDVPLTFPVGCQELLRRSISDFVADGKTVPAGQMPVPLYVNEHFLDIDDNPYESIALGVSRRGVDVETVSDSALENVDSEQGVFMLFGKTTEMACTTGSSADESAESRDGNAPKITTGNSVMDTPLYENADSLDTAASSPLQEMAPTTSPSKETVFEHVELCNTAAERTDSFVSSNDSSHHHAVYSVDKITVSSCHELKAPTNDVETFSSENLNTGDSNAVKIETSGINCGEPRQTQGIVKGKTETPEYSLVTLSSHDGEEETLGTEQVLDNTEQPSLYEHVWSPASGSDVKAVGLETINKTKTSVADASLCSASDAKKKQSTDRVKQLTSAPYEHVWFSTGKTRISNSTDLPEHEPLTPFTSDHASKIKNGAAVHKSLITVTSDLDNSHSDDSVSDDNQNTGMHKPGKLGSERLRPFRSKKEQTLNLDDEEDTYKPGKLQVDRLLPFEKIKSRDARKACQTAQAKQTHVRSQQNNEAGSSNSKQEKSEDLVKEKQSEAVREKQSEVLKEKQSAVGKEKQSAVGKEKQPDVVKEKKTEVIKEKKDEVEKEKKSAVIKEKQSEVVKDKQSAVLIEKPSAVGKEKQFAVGKEKQTDVVKEKKTEVVKEKKDEVVKEKNTEVVKEKKDEVVKEKKTEVGKQKKDEVVKEKKEEVVKEKKTEVVKEKRTEVKEKKDDMVKDEVVKEKQTRVVKEKQTRVVKEKQTEVVKKQTEVVKEKKTEVKDKKDEVVKEKQTEVVKKKQTEVVKEKQPEFVKEKQSDIEIHKHKTENIYFPEEIGLKKAESVSADKDKSHGIFALEHDHVYEDIKHPDCLKTDELATDKNKLEEVVVEENPYESISFPKRRPKRIRQTLSSIVTDV